MALLIMSVTLAVVSLASASVYSSWVAASNHRAYCNRTEIILNAFDDVISLAFSPTPGDKPPTFAQAARIAAFETAAFARIDKARC